MTLRDARTPAKHPAHRAEIVLLGFEKQTHEDIAQRVGLERFSCGALVDANSRLSRLAGDPKSTDAEGLIKQPNRQKVRSAGFLMITAAPRTGDRAATLTFAFHDERGKLLHEHVK